MPLLKGEGNSTNFTICNAKERFDPLFTRIFTPLQHYRVEESPLKLSKKLTKPCDYKRRFTVCHFWKEKGNGTKMCPAPTGQLLASHAGVFRGARFRPSPQTPTQPRIILFYSRGKWPIMINSFEIKCWQAEQDWQARSSVKTWL